MKIIIGPTPDFERTGGVSTHVHMLRNGLLELGHDVQVMSYDPPRLYRAPLITIPSLILRQLSMYIAARWEDMFRNVYYLMNVLYLVIRYDIQVMNVQNAMHMRIANCTKKLTGCDAVLTVHGRLTLEAIQSGRCTPASRFANWLLEIERRGYADADTVVAVSSSAENHLKKFGVSGVVIHNGIDTKQYTLASRELRRQANVFGLLFAGKCISYKGLLDAIEVLSLLRVSGFKVTLAVAGDGPDLEKAKKLACEHGVQHLVTWHGNLEKSRMPAFYASGDAVLVPSVGQEGVEDSFPYTVLEAMACGLPVVAYRTGGIPEQIVDGRTGYLVNVGDKTAMADAVVRLLHADDRVDMARQARARVEHAFSAIHMAQRFLGVYQANSKQM